MPVAAGRLRQSHEGTRQSVHLLAIAARRALKQDRLLAIGMVYACNVATVVCTSPRLVAAQRSLEPKRQARTPLFRKQAASAPLALIDTLQYCVGWNREQCYNDSSNSVSAQPPEGILSTPQNPAGPMALA